VVTAFPHATVELWAVDEHRIGLMPITQKVWCFDGQRPLAPVQHRYEWRYLVGFVHPTSGRTIFHLATSVSIPLFEAELAAFAHAVGAASPARSVVAAMDVLGFLRRIPAPRHAVSMHSVIPTIPQTNASRLSAVTSVSDVPHQERSTALMRRASTHSPMPAIVGANIDTFIGNARITGEFPDALAAHLEDLKRRSQEVEEDLPTPWQFAGEVLFIKPHGAGRQWRWILHSPSIHVDVGLGKLTHIVAKARLSSAFLWEHEIGVALTLLYGFLADFLQVSFTLQVSEVHLCIDLAGWELAVGDVGAFITRSRSKGLRLGSDAADEELDSSLEATGPFIAPSDMRLQFAGRRLATLDFSKGAPHACCLYDKTAEIAVSRKDWMHEVWQSNGWDGESRVTRVEFRYKRECLREMSVEEAYAFLDQLPALWAYSTKLWLRHTMPTAIPTEHAGPSHLSGSWCSRPASSAMAHRLFVNGAELVTSRCSAR
jgi:hypothetical protein